MFSMMQRENDPKYRIIQQEKKFIMVHKGEHKNGEIKKATTHMIIKSKISRSSTCIKHILTSYDL